MSAGMLLQDSLANGVRLLGGANDLLRGGVWAIMPWELRLRW